MVTVDLVPQELNSMKNYSDDELLLFIEQTYSPAELVEVIYGEDMAKFLLDNDGIRHEILRHDKRAEFLPISEV